ncbi:hypothetical protein TNCV_903881 [Trichonephila clavipes]|nr:hypothetical protein TNCV_903881 [Trichonephila clavipes]
MVWQSRLGVKTTSDLRDSGPRKLVARWMADGDFRGHRWNERLSGYGHEAGRPCVLALVPLRPRHVEELTRVKSVEVLPLA